MTIRKKPKEDDKAADGDRWHGRPVLSRLVSAAVFIIPIGLSIVAATIAAHVLPRPRGAGWVAGWWAVVLGVPTIVLVVTDRLARKALPLAVLLKMTMVFPDRAPKRLAVARKAGSTRDLARRVEEAKTHGINDEPVLAAEKILALAAALNAHDRLTRGHGERVRAYTDLIADELDLPQHDRDRLRWSALLHDIGKLAVHPHILNKPGKLNDDEWAVIKNHPLEGAKVTAPLAGWLGEWANTIAEHHEKYDGTGYPYGLTGGQISYGGRIVAVADCYDTMTAIRSYKRPMSPEAARTELAACAGSHFDPKVVRAFLDVSIGRLRPVAGPLAWIASLPFVTSVPRLGQAAAALGRVGATTAMVAGAVTVGALVQGASQATAAPHRNQVTLSTNSPSAASAPGSRSGSPAGNATAVNATRPAGHVAVPAGGPGSTPPAPGVSVPGRSGPPGSGGGGTRTGTTMPGSPATSTPDSPAATVAGSPSTTVQGSPATTIAGSPPTTIPGSSATVPSAPTGVTAQAGDAQATVSWSAPSDGGSPLTTYTVTPYIAGVAQPPQTVPSSATTLVVTGLTNGTVYTFRVVATNDIGSSVPSAASPAVTPTAPSLSIINGTGQAGRPQQGDQIIVTFSPAPPPSAFCAGWTSASQPLLVGPNVVVHGTQPASGDDTLTVTDTGDCNGGFHFGTIDLGQRGDFSNTVSFGGPSLSCLVVLTSGCSTIHWNDQNTLTITLGAASSGQPTQGALSVAVYTPDPALGLTATISSTKEENF